MKKTRKEGKKRRRKGERRRVVKVVDHWLEHETRGYRVCVYEKSISNTRLHDFYDPIVQILPKKLIFVIVRKSVRSCILGY